LFQGKGSPFFFASFFVFAYVFDSMFVQLIRGKGIEVKREAEAKKEAGINCVVSWLSFGFLMGI
jgi:hypothetical protein